MPFVEIPSKDNLSVEISNIFEDFKYKMGLPDVPNILKVMSHSENVTRGTWSLMENTLVNGLTPRSVKEMLIMAISISRGCNYCQTSHSVISRMIGIDTEVFQTISKKPDEISPHIIRDILNFGIKCAKDPQSLNREDFRSLEQYNLSQSEIIEIISIVGLAVYFNIFVDATGIVSDAMFS
jgi:uncharacterized peroxidase-related enzyme